MQKSLLFNNEELLFLPSESEYEYQWDEALHGYHILLPNGNLFYSEHFFNKTISDRFTNFLIENDTYIDSAVNWRDIEQELFSKITFKNIIWKQDSISLYGKTIPLPRLTSWYGDNNRSYKYSGILSRPNEWNKGLLYIKNRIEKVSGIPFNSVLLNWYRDGNDHLSWHSDDEKELGKNPTIASVSFGEQRDFVLRSKDKSRKIKIPLKHGTLLIMSGELQHYWEHSVPKRKKVKTSRFNLTFRVIS